MEISEYTMRVLEPAPGHWLTEADEALAPRERTLSKKVYLAATASPSDWKDITEEQAQAITAARAEPGSQTLSGHEGQ